MKKGDACDIEDGLAMLKRQVICYSAALDIAKKLCDGEDEVDEGAVREFKESIGNKTYTGRPIVSPPTHLRQRTYSHNSPPTHICVLILVFYQSSI